MVLSSDYVRVYYKIPIKDCHCEGEHPNIDSLSALEFHSGSGM